MKKILSMLMLLFCITMVCKGIETKNESRPIDGYFVINDNRTVDFFLLEDKRIDYTETGVKAGVPFSINITQPSSGLITWQTLSTVSGTYLLYSQNNGRTLYYRTSSTNGTLVLLGTDDSGNQITITVHITDGGIS